MYPYHNKIKARFANNELVQYKYVKSYKKIAPCLLLYFNAEPFIRPIWQHRFEKYKLILNLNLQQRKHNICGFKFYVSNTYSSLEWSVATSASSELQKLV